MAGNTIAAIATAMNASGIGIVRMSGEDSLSVLSRIFGNKGGKLYNNVDKFASHTIHYGYVYDQDTMIDEVLVMVMKGPRSYTGEDTVEIDCHGGILAMRKVLEAVLHAGARPAEPGEFTKRAFLNGRIDLSQAEAVIDVINAQNEYALESSMNQLKGSLLHAIEEIRSKIIYHIAYIESALDDPEHISVDGYGEELAVSVREQKKAILKLKNSFEEGKIIKEGIKTVIVGKPNAGKSSLLNRLLREEKAIVTEIAGTTRDVLEETIVLQGISLKMMDTAGIHETEDIVEKIGVERARKFAKEADLILYVVDSSSVLDENDEEIISLLKNKKAIILLNKSDLDTVTTKEILENKTDCPILSISAKLDEGIEDLENMIRDMFFEGQISFNDEVYITNVRHKNALEEAYQSLEMVENSIEAGMPEDFFSIDLMNSYEALGRIIGESVGEDLVNEIFSKFCTGK